MSVSHLQNWYCLKTKPRLELKAEKSLQEIGIETFLPLLRNYSRIQNFHCCLFPTYIFGLFNAAEFLQTVKRAYGVSYVVTCGDEPVPVDGQIIQEIRRGMEGGYARPDSLKVGDEVIVTSGPFAELRGVFHREISGTERAVILLRTLHQARIELSRFDLRRENLRVGDQCEA
jgi:transcriptional antiterminator RfaH